MTIKYKVDSDMNFTWISESNRDLPPVPSSKFNFNAGVTDHVLVTDFVRDIERINKVLMKLPRVNVKP